MVSTGMALRRPLGVVVVVVAWAPCLALRLGLCGEGDGLAIVTEYAAGVGEEAASNAGESGVEVVVGLSFVFDVITLDDGLGQSGQDRDFPMPCRCSAAQPVL